MSLLMSQTAPPRIAVVNHSTLIDNAVVYNFTKSLQRQVHRDFAPIWGADAIVVATLAENVKPYQWVLGIFDNSDQANALGYHDLTPQGLPVMKVFVADSNAAGVSVSSVASHELCETLADPFIQGVVLLDNGDGTGRIFMQEVCDPVEADSYAIYGNQMSNFATPWWFGDPKPAADKFDFLGNLTAPFTMTPGGFFGFRDITSSGLGPWTQSFADQRGKQLAKLTRGSRKIAELKTDRKLRFPKKYTGI